MGAHFTEGCLSMAASMLSLAPFSIAPETRARYRLQTALSLPSEPLHAASAQCGNWGLETECVQHQGKAFEPYSAIRCF